MSRTEIQEGACRECIYCDKCRKDFPNLKIDGKRWCAGFHPFEREKVIFT